MIDLARIGGPVACIGLAVLFAARGPRDRLAGLGFTLVGATMLAVAIAPDEPVTLAGVVLGAIAAAAALGAVFRRFPWLVPLLALATVPVRIGFLGHKLLVPLYAVCLGAAALLGWQLLRGDERSRELRLATWPLALYVGWVGLSLAWSQDVREGAVELLAFYLPLGVVALSIARLPWSAPRIRVLYAELAAMALAFACVGFYQYETRDIFQNPKVITSNAYAAFFRVNSVFWDPSVYGRFLVVALIPTVVVVVLGRSRWTAAAGFALVVVTWLGLLISFSQSSFAALLVGVTGVAVVAWRWRAAVAVVVAAAVLAGLASSEPRLRHALVSHTTKGLNNATSGRASLVANGIRIAVAHPAAGVGVGGFRTAYAKRLHLRSVDSKAAASHNTPVTVAAETGLVGLALFAALVAAVLVDGLRRVDRGVRGRAALAAGLMFAAILVHSLFYNDFFEDPTTWLLLGVVALAAARPGPAPERAPAVEVEEAVPA